MTTRKMELVKLGGMFSVTEQPEIGTTNFMSWERLDREVFKKLFPNEYVTGISVSERGLEVRLERIPKEVANAG